MVGLGIGIAVAGRRQWWPTGADYALDFANNRYMVDGVEVPASAAFSFSRGTPAAMADGQGNWRSFPADSLRRINGIGALLEPAATNLVRASDDIGGPGWTPPPAQLTRSGNATDGWQFTVNSAYSGFLAVEQSFSVIASGSLVNFGFDLHEGGLSRSALWTPIAGYAAFFDASVGSAMGTGASMAPLGAGWWRCRWSVTPTSALSAVRLRLGNTAGGVDYLSGQFVRWRAPQVEVSQRTSYFVNTSTSASASRDGDLLSLSLPAGQHNLSLRFSSGADQFLGNVSGPHVLNVTSPNAPALAGIFAESI